MGIWQRTKRMPNTDDSHAQRALSVKQCGGLTGILEIISPSISSYGPNFNSPAASIAAHCARVNRMRPGICSYGATTGNGSAICVIALPLGNRVIAHYGTALSLACSRHPHYNEHAECSRQ